MQENGSENKKKYDVTVIIATFNPVLEKLLTTIRSVLYQKNIRVEIIVTDDGSKKIYKKELEALFIEYGFKRYRLLFNQQNLGTCHNYYNAIQYAGGKYIKLLSPGDYFNDEYALENWIAFMNKYAIELCYCDIVCYHYENNQIMKVDVENCVPQLNRFTEFQNYNKKKVLMGNLLLRDCPVGAAIMAEKKVIHKYLAKLIEVIKFSEDNYLRLALLDGVKLVHFQYTAICYEYGSGISTNGNSKWDKIIFDEFMVV